MRSAFAACYRAVVGDGKPPIEEYLEHMGESFPRIMDRLGLPHTLWEPYKDFCERHIDRITIFPGIAEVLDWARASGIELAVLTGKDQKRTLQILDHFELSSFFDLVLGCDQLQHSKPHPEGVLRILEHFDCQSHEAVAIGDSVSDIVAAQRAKVTAIAVTWGIKPDRLRQMCRPDHTVDDRESLIEVLSQIAVDGYSA